VSAWCTKRTVAVRPYLVLGAHVRAEAQHHLDHLEHELHLLVLLFSILQHCNTMA
jgi:hypothetical protein